MISYDNITTKAMIITSITIMPWLIANIANEHFHFIFLEY